MPKVILKNSHQGFNILPRMKKGDDDDVIRNILVKNEMPIASDHQKGIGSGPAQASNTRVSGNAIKGSIQIGHIFSRCRFAPVMA